MFVFLAAIPLVLMNTEQDPKDTALYKVPFIYVGGTLQKAYAGFSGMIRGTTRQYLDLIGLKNEMAEIRDENQLLKAKLMQYEEVVEENKRLGQLLNFKIRTKMKLLPAKVVGHDLSADHFTITINRGLKHGLKKLQAVISVDGVVGYIFEPQQHISQVLLLTDRSASVDAIVQRTRARGISVGRSVQSCRLRYLERSDDIKEGDKVVTSGLQGYFPKGFPIGEVETIKSTEYGISVEAFLKPSVNASKLEEVFIVLETGEADLKLQSQSEKEEAPKKETESGE